MNVGAGAVICVTMIVRLWRPSGRITVTLYFAPGRTLKYTFPFESVFPDGFSLGSGGAGVQLKVPFRTIIAFAIGLRLSSTMRIVRPLSAITVQYDWVAVVETMLTVSPITRPKREKTGRNIAIAIES
jgi:hypothetical protein